MHVYGKRKALLIGLGGFGLLVFLAMVLENPNAAIDKRAAASTADGQAKAEKSEAAFKAMSAADHLREAEKLIQPNAARDVLHVARKHLLAIPKDAPEFKKFAVLDAKINGRSNAIDKAEERAAEQAEIEKNPLTVVHSEWRKGGFDSVALWSVTFKNRSTKPVGNIKYHTEYSSETGGIVDHGGEGATLGHGPIQKVIPPGQTRTIEINDGFVHSAAHRASFKMVGWEFVTDAR